MRGGCDIARSLMDEYVQFVREVASIRARMIMAVSHDESTDELETLIQIAERTKRQAKDDRLAITRAPFQTQKNTPARG
jgi:hypothetical protein